MRPLDLVPKDFTIRTEEMDTHTTYLLCPDHTCDLYFDTSRFCPCEHHCPKQKELVKIIKCLGCGRVVELPGDHSGFCRVDCPDCGIMNLRQRLSGSYRLIYERPKEK